MAHQTLEENKQHEKRKQNEQTDVILEENVKIQRMEEQKKIINILRVIQ